MEIQLTKVAIKFFFLIIDKPHKELKVRYKRELMKTNNDRTNQQIVN